MVRQMEGPPSLCASDCLAGSSAWGVLASYAHAAIPIR